MKKTQTHIAYALVTALIMVVIGVALQLMKMGDHPILKWIGIVVFLVGIIMNAQAYSKVNAADVTFGQVFGSCFKATLIISIILTIWTLASLSIFPEIKTMAMEKAQEQMDKMGNLSSEQMDKAIGFSRNFFTPITVGSALIGSLVFGALFSVIGAAVAKKVPRTTGNYQ